MPEVGLLTAGEPLEPNYKVVIKYSVEVEGLPVYTETYDVSKLERELNEEPEKFIKRWMRRVKCVVGCRRRSGFSACLTRCLNDGQCCDLGHEKESSID